MSDERNLTTRRKLKKLYSDLANVLNSCVLRDLGLIVLPYAKEWQGVVKQKHILPCPSHIPSQIDATRLLLKQFESERLLIYDFHHKTSIYLAETCRWTFVSMSLKRSLQQFTFP
jgi:hypothetical protein